MSDEWNEALSAANEALLNKRDELLAVHHKNTGGVELAATIVRLLKRPPPVATVTEGDIAHIIDPEAWAFFDNLTPTERELWNEESANRQRDATEKARAILALSNPRP